MTQADEQQPSERSVQRGRWIALLVDAFVLLALIPIGILIGLVASLGAIGCSDEHARPICRPSMQTLVALLPPGTAAAAALVLVVMGAIWIRKQRSAAGWHGTAWIMVVVAAFISLGIGFGSSDG